MNTRLGRREVLRLAVIGSAGAAFAACGGGAPALDCDDVSNLSATDASFRTGQGYVETSTRPGRTCDTCNFYTAVPNACGTCTLIRGPINPAGYCNLWVQRPA